MSNHLRTIIAPLVAMAAGAALAIGGAMPAFADSTVTEDGIIYTLNSGATATVSGYTGTPTVANIQSSVSSGGTTYNVNAVGDSALENDAALTEISIPSSVTSVGVDAFFYDSAVTSLTLSTGLETIGAGAFATLGITTLTIPATVTTLGVGALSSGYLTSVYFLGTAPTSVGAELFGPNPDVTVYYTEANSSGWTSPNWDGYSSVEIPTPIMALPANDSLYTIDCSGQFSRVDATNGDATPRGEPADLEQCGFDAAWDPYHSTAYFENTQNASELPAGSHNPIYRVDVTTGAIKFAFQPTIAGVGPVALSSFAIDGKGVMYAIYPGDEGTDPMVLYKVDTTSGAMKRIGSTQLTDLVAIGADPKTGKLYGINGDGSILYSIDTGSGAAEPQTQSLGLDFGQDGYVDSLRVDSSGNIWVEADDGGTDSEAWVIDPSNSYSVTHEWALTADNTPFDAWSLMVVVPSTKSSGGSTLATTGTSINPVTIPLALLALGGGSSLAIVGWIRGRRRRQAQPQR